MVSPGNYLILVKITTYLDGTKYMLQKVKCPTLSAFMAVTKASMGDGQRIFKMGN